MQKHILRRPLLSSVGVSTRCNHITASSSLFNNNNINNSINNNITKRSLYTPIPEDKKPKATESFPWRTYTIPSTYTTSNHSPHMKSMAADLHVATYNPMGKALKPPHPIILLPGLCTNHTIFSTLARELNYPYGLVAMNYHARAESKPQNLSKSTSTSGDSIKNHVYDLLRVLRSLDQTHAFVVGHGFGGFVGLLAMRMFPDRISGLVLLDSGFSAVHGDGEESASPSPTTTTTTSGAESSTATATTPINTHNVKRSLPEHVLSG